MSTPASPTAFTTSYTKFDGPATFIYLILLIGSRTLVFLPSEGHCSLYLSDTIAVLSKFFFQKFLMITFSLTANTPSLFLMHCSPITRLILENKCMSAI